MLKHAIASPTSEIAGVINTNCFIERIGLEDFRCEVRIVPISLCEKSAANDDFADLAGWSRCAALIRYADFHTVDRTASGDDTSVGKPRRGEGLRGDES